MFVKAIETVSQYTRPLLTLTRNYGSTIVDAGAATIFFVNEEACAITCKHVAINLYANVDENYKKFKDEKQKIGNSTKKYNKRLKDLEKSYGYSTETVVQIKNRFQACVEKLVFDKIIFHDTEDLALIKFKDWGTLHYSGYATFVKEDSSVKQGKSLCRLGYPFPEYSNFRFNEELDEIEWTNDAPSLPTFPIDGILTRHIASNGKITGIEMSTPGLRGQSGGPLFDSDGIIYGMQSQTAHLHLGFDIKNHKIKVNGVDEKVSNHPFLHVGRCIHANVIKEFLDNNEIKYYIQQ